MSRMSFVSPVSRVSRVSHVSHMRHSCEKPNFSRRHFSKHGETSVWHRSSENDLAIVNTCQIHVFNHAYVIAARLEKMD